MMISMMGPKEIVEGLLYTVQVVFVLFFFKFWLYF
jgi:hypothetical protein